jgi:uncharacterized membrane protein YqgA involved in biofilm formation
VIVMTQRIAAAMSLVVFVICLIAGTTADNPLATILSRAMLAMVVTLVIGLVVGAMAHKMLDENLKSAQEKLKNDAAHLSEDGR